MVKNVITAGGVGRAALGCPEATALATFAVLSKGRPGFFVTFFDIPFVTLSLFLPRFLKKSLNLYASIVLSLTVIDFFPLQIEQ